MDDDNERTELAVIRSMDTDMTVAAVSQARSDAQVVHMWLHGRSEHTIRAYEREARRFLDGVKRPLTMVALEDVQRYVDGLGQLASSSQQRALASVKSLLSFAHRIGYCRFDVGAAVKLPKVRDTLAERILAEAMVQRLLALETDARNHAILRLLYASGARVSELCALRWRDLQPRGDGGQVALYGKGGKTRVVLLSVETWRVVVALRGEAGGDEPVFVSRKGGALGAPQVFRIVRAAGARIGEPRLSPHWLRHAHATHALERGAPIHLVQSTLGHGSVATTGRYLHARPSDSSARFLGV